MLTITNDINESKDQFKKHVDLFNEIYEKCFLSVYAAALKYTGNKEDAEDITNTAFTVFWENIHKIDKLEFLQLKKWLHSAAKFIIFNRGRNKTNNEIPISDDIEDIPVTSIELPDNIAVSNESVDKIKKEINNLDYKYRNVITMKFGDKYSTHEIADMFNISIKTVYTLVARGKNILKEKLIEEEVLPDDKKKPE